MKKNKRATPYDRKFYFEHYASSSLKELSLAGEGRFYYPDLAQTWDALLGATGETGLSRTMADCLDPFSSIASVSSLHMHHVHGLKTYVVNEEMHDLFLRTDLTNVTLEDLEIPHKCIHIAVPPGRYQLWGGERTGWHDCDGVFLRKQMYYELPQEVKLRLGSELHAVNEWSEMEVKLAAVGMTYDDVRRYQKPGFVINAGGYPSAASERFDDDAQSFSYVSASDWTNPRFSDGDNPPNAEHFLRTKVYASDGKEANPEFNSLKGETRKRRDDMLFDLYKVALNALVYMNNGLATKVVQRHDRREYERFAALYRGAASPSKRDTFGRKATRLGFRPTVTILGVGLEKNDLTGEEKGVLVRGHWHTYLVGPGRQRRELRWLQPYVRMITVNKDTGGTDAC